MKHFKHLSIVAVSFVLIFTACTGTDPVTTEITLAGNWVKRSDFDGNGRQGAASFVIGDTAYLGTGFDGTNRYNDFWRYDATRDSWSQRALFPGAKRNTGVGYTVGARGYIATGYDGINRLQDNWEYNPANNIWTRKADLPDGANNPVGSGARYGAVGFGIGTKGYVLGGFNGSHQKDLWEYNPSNDMWSQLVSMGGTKRQGAVAMVYSGKAYIVSGVNNGTTVNDMWQYDPTNAATPWKELRNINNTSTDIYDDNYTSILRSNAVGFVIGDKGFLTTGENGSFNKTTWEYDFATDVWLRKSDFEKSERSGACGFAVMGKGYTAFGRNSTFYWDDVAEFKPTAVSNLND